MSKHLTLKRILQIRQRLGIAINNNDIELAHRIQGVLLSEYSDLLQLNLNEIEGNHELHEFTNMDSSHLLNRLSDADYLNWNRRLMSNDNSKPIDLAVERVKKAAKHKPLVLVYCEKYLDGKVMTIEAYKELRKSFDRCDQETHQAVIVDADMADSVIECLNDVMTLEDVLSLKKAK
jgi:hypothetical protein